MTKDFSLAVIIYIIIILALCGVYVFSHHKNNVLDCLGSYCYEYRK